MLVIVRMTSSVNRLILCSCVVKGVTEIGVFALICSARGSISRLKNRGDKGQPCLVLFVIWNGVERMSDV